VYQYRRHVVEYDKDNGLLVPDSNKWPNVIKAVADQIHGLG